MSHTLSMMTKKKIIEKLKTAETATIAFKGLISEEEVDARRTELIDHCKAQVARCDDLHPGGGVILVKAGRSAESTHRGRGR